MFVHAYNPFSEDGGRRIMVRDCPGKKHETISEKQTKPKRAVGVTQVGECLPSEP
jgi:hypothetical protein